MAQNFLPQNIEKINLNAILLKANHLSPYKN